MKIVFIFLLAFQLFSIHADDEEDYTKAGSAFGTQLWTIDGEEDSEARSFRGNPVERFFPYQTHVALTTVKLMDVTGWNCHIWIGRTAPDNHIDTALKFATDLGARFKKKETYYIEVDRNESPLFKASFSQEFHSTYHDQRDPPKLYLVKGKTNMWVVRIPLNIASLNEEDCFLLDSGSNSDVFSLCGKDASTEEKEFTRKLGNALLEKEHEAPEEEVKDVVFSADFVSRVEHTNFEAFLKQFGTISSQDKEKFGKVYGLDDDFGKQRKDEIEIFRISPDNEENSEEKMTIPQNIHALNSPDCYVIDTMSTAGILVSIGKTSTKREIYRALKMALITIADRKGRAIKRGHYDWKEASAKIKIHVLQHKRAPSTPDFIFNFVESTREYLEDPKGDVLPKAE